MTQPFDTKDLVAKLKAKGLDVAEELVATLANEVLDWTSESCLLHTNPIVKMGAGVVSAVKPIIMEQIDKIDGQVG